MTRTFCSSLSQAQSVRVFCWLLLASLGITVHGQDIPPRKFTVHVTASVQESPPKITLQWTNEGDATGYTVSRRTLNGGWQQLTTLGGGDTSWTDGNVSVGTPYEYQIVKRTSGKYTGYGYIRAGIRAPALDLPGKVIVLVENSIAGALGAELDQLRADLTGEGWVVLRQNVSASDSPQSVKNIIRNAYSADPNNLKAVFLVGHVPVPYSGNIMPDGHPNHQGAWPADLYYGEMTSEWTDSTVNTKSAERQTNWNVPGDGKFDQGEIPSEVELMVGRVDLSNMTCYSNKNPARSEIDLMRAYFNKLHRFRVGDMAINRRGLICDNFGDKGDDPIAGSAWRSFSGMFGSQNVSTVPWDGYFPAATGQNYLWSFASGGGSYYYSMGVGTSDDFALKSVRVIFTMFMGSYFGDWNNESNFLRAALGSGDVLTSSYSGFPHTYYFPMALGETIGYCIRMSQNNGPGGLYPYWSQGTREVHVALHGDPTLRLFPVKPAGNLAISTEPGTARLSWSASPDSNLLGYYVYRATSPDGPFTRLTSSPVSGTTFSDTPAAGSYTYMVRAIKLEQSASGTYLNPSLGIRAGVTVTGSVAQTPGTPSLQANVASHSRVDLQWNDVANETGYRLERKTGSNGSWGEIANLGAGTTSYADQGLSGLTEYFYRIRAFNAAGASAFSAEVRVVTHAAPQPPAAPALQANVVSHSRVDLTWNNVANETGYKLERKTSSNGTWAEIVSLNADVTSFSNTGLAASTEYFYRIRAVNGAGLSAYSNEIRAVTAAPPQPQATVRFVEGNNTSQGNWPAKYGAEGYVIAAEPSRLPPSVQLSASGKSDFIWQPRSTDPRALLTEPHATTRIASAWYGNNIILNLNVASDASKLVALYFVDWDRVGRSQTVTVIDSATSLPLDSRELTSFGDGKYLVYQIKGSVRIEVNKSAGPNAVVMGVFAGGPVPGPISNDPLRLSVRDIRSGELKLLITGKAGQKFNLEACTEFGKWSLVQNGTMSADSMEVTLSLDPAKRWQFFRTVNQP